MEYRHKTSPILLFYSLEAPLKLMALSSFVWFRLPIPFCKNVWRTLLKDSYCPTMSEYAILSTLSTSGDMLATNAHGGTGR